MATGLEAAIACACLRQGCQWIQRHCCDQDENAQNEESGWALSIGNFCNAIFCCNGCNFFSGSTTNIHGNISAGGNVNINSAPPINSPAVDEVARRIIASQPKDNAGESRGRGFEVSV